MVSLQTTLSQKERFLMHCLTTGSSITNTAIDASKKRKREDDDQIQAKEEWDGGPSSKEAKPSRATNNIRDPSAYVEFQLEDSPLPPDWQRCLDIESGRISFYNTRTRRRTSRDPRQGSLQLSLNLNLNLNLDLNVCCESQSQNKDEDQGEEVDNAAMWSSSSPGDGAMVAAVCMHCHILVMMCKTSPSCPNCKFLHAPTLAYAKQFPS